MTRLLFISWKEERKNQDQNQNSKRKIIETQVWITFSGEPSYYLRKQSIIFSSAEAQFSRVQKFIPESIKPARTKYTRSYIKWPWIVPWYSKLIDIDCLSKQENNH